MANCFDIRKRNMLSQTDNMAGLWWKRKGMATSTLQPAHLLRLQAIHQQFHRYIPRHDFVSGVDKGIYDHPSGSQDLTDTTLFAQMDTLHP